MTVVRVEDRDERLSAIHRQITERLPADFTDVAATFADTFYEFVVRADEGQLDADQLFGAIVGMAKFGHTRRSGIPLIRAFNPNHDQNGWRGRHTVIEVITDDMPFLVNSVSLALNGLGLSIHLLVHPVICACREDRGMLTALVPFPAEQADTPGKVESWMHIHVDEQTDPTLLSRIEAQLAASLEDVRTVTDDWGPMRDRMAEAVAELQQAAFPNDLKDEALSFLTWLGDDHFTFLGYRDYHYTGAETGSATIDPTTGLGLLRSDGTTLFGGQRRAFNQLSEPLRRFLLEPVPLVVSKADRQSRVHRAVQLDTVTVKRLGPDGTVVGDRVFAGLFTAVAYNRSTRDIPFLRQKVERVIDMAGFDTHGHNGKALANILDTYPRDELFQITDRELYTIALGILRLKERQRTALFTRADPFGRFVSALVFVPRDRYDTNLRIKFQTLLKRAFGATDSSFRIRIDESVHAQVHFTLATDQPVPLDLNTLEVEQELVAAARTWGDRLQAALVDVHGEEQGLALLHRYRDAFSPAYIDAVVPSAAIGDLMRVEQVCGTRRTGMNLYRPLEAGPTSIHFKLYHAGGPIPLSDVLPMLENMGLKVVSEIPYEVRPLAADGSPLPPIFIHDFDTVLHTGGDIDLASVKRPFEEAFARVWDGVTEDDGFNRLVIGAGLDWRQISILRAFGKYMRQARAPFTNAAIYETLEAFPAIACRIVKLFETRFNPDLKGDRALQVAAIGQEIDQLLEAVESLEQDRILRRFINLVTATVRTNAYQQGPDGALKPYISFKLVSSEIEGLPKPHPWREIWVYSPRVEAVHLRGGPVARGGLRWSDRRDDFRDEILDLVKAQMVKNAVIVPVGSKGGFYVKRPPTERGRAAAVAEAQACYRIMMRGLLDITDNQVRNTDGTVTLAPPDRVIRHDEDDPYLVVAADKGTATFSDIANGISQEYGFWLGDAFASGGSAGYDHKKMGITARGAWESVKRHFRERGVDTQTQPFTVIGIGDMGGDVFGNGMLLSEQIKLVAAFNHLHIFVDPTPDPATTFAERQRLFDAVAGWDQYDTSLLSPGGMIINRRDKSITLTPQVQAMVGTDRAKMTPTELMHSLLCADVDLLWFGGIGTYIKDREESHNDVTDKANDAVRVDADQVRAKVIGEGANLGMTQRGRIALAHRGVRLNTDFIDNSAGVDCSDHEVNIKILLDDVVSAGDLTGKQRNQLLEAMTDEVADLVLKDNYHQTQALSDMVAEAADVLDQHARLMRELERAGKLDRRIEDLPDDEALTDRLGARAGLTRPELCLILAYGKIDLYDRLLRGSLPDDPFLAKDLVEYFPTPLRARFGDGIARHALRREIIVTTVTNSMVNRTGPTFVAEMLDKTGLSSSDVAKAYIIVRDAFHLPALWARIEALDAQVDAAVQTQMLRAIRALIDRATAWMLRHYADELDIGRQIAHFEPGIEQLHDNLDSIVHAGAKDVLHSRSTELEAKGVPHDVAWDVASLNVVTAGLDLIRIGDVSDQGVSVVGPLYFELGQRLGLAWLRDSTRTMAKGTHWQKQAVAAIVDDLYALQADLTLKVIDQSDDPGDVDASLTGWIARRRAPIDRIDQLVTELKALDHMDVSMLAVANRRLRGLMPG